MSQLEECDKPKKEDCAECFKFVGEEDKVFSADKSLKQKKEEIKMCDCVVFCKEGNIYICVEITSGTLNRHEYKRKIQQVENCYLKLKQIHKVECKKVILYGSIDLARTQEEEFKKKLKKMRIKTIKILEKPKLCE